jgi:hypothetical protein
MPQRARAGHPGGRDARYGVGGDCSTRTTFRMPDHDGRVEIGSFYQMVEFTYGPMKAFGTPS